MEKYKLPATSPAFEGLSFAELLQERYEDLYVEARTIALTIKGGVQSGEEQVLQSRLADIQRALHEPVAFESGDALIDEWERDIAEGRTPNLMKGWVPPPVKEKKKVT